MSEFDPEKFMENDEALKEFNAGILEEFRANHGKIGGIFEGFDVVLLTAKGARSGLSRLTPLVSLSIDGKMVVIGSRGGAPKDPAWVHNVRANPQGQLEIGTHKYEVTVREVRDEERDALFDKVVVMAPNYGEYQAKTTRVIPLFELRPN
ncbi:deazaflavin-dependent nitroreductase [Mycobacterium paraffinicum]|uniref:Deazaflavin-dependent nitroreductase n=1 Tax=Mycobacterium paraffinicum TaxID=53378 RepID=A0A1Q4HYG6_9MYCO|nr:nitroreductase family deazaflavin-dependent oxidoreductase [Mycobacterium paraffinicum]OJZ74737.1 deazaflavin-dependent nitroreductase [Mycobacterium paraffinicum]